MMWLVFMVLQIVVIVRGVRQEQAAGEWSWSKLFFALSFAALEFVIIVVPLYVVPQQSRWFVTVVTLSCIVAAGNFVWFIVACRRWRLPDGRTSLEAARGVPPPSKHS
jgi:hypothetical protein